MTPEEVAANPKLAVPFERAPIGVVKVFGQDVQWVRILRTEYGRDGKEERSLVAPDNDRGRNGAAFWIEAGTRTASSTGRTGNKTACSAKPSLAKGLGCT